jgi:hypothetical protein
VRGKRDGTDASNLVLSLPKMPSGGNTFEISDFQEDEIKAG